MKKLIASVLACVMLLSAFGVSAASLDFMRNPAKNYSTAVETSMKFVNPEEFCAALGENEIEETGIVNLALLFNSLLSFDGVYEMKADISDDYNTMKIYLNQKVDYDVDVNEYLSISADMKSESWIDIDITNIFAPKCLYVVRGPISEKYMYTDLFASMTAEEKTQIAVILKMIVNEQFVEKVCNTVTDSYEKHGKVEADGKNVTLTLDNEAFLKVIDDAVALVFEQLGAVAGEAIAVEIPEFASLGVGILGDKGYVLEYSEDGTVKECLNLRINLSEWTEVIDSLYYDDFYDYYIDYYEDETEDAAEETEAPLVLEFEITSRGKMFDIGTTKIELPTLTEENSINLDDMYKDEYYEEDYYEEEYEPEYPILYAAIDAEYLPIVEGNPYVPFRAMLEDAYDGNVNIGYDNGFITVTSEYFTDLEKLSFKVGETKANVDGFDFEVGEILLVDGVTYVSIDFFEVIFGWERDMVEYDYVNNEYFILFCTDPWDSYWD